MLAVDDWLEGTVELFVKVQPHPDTKRRMAIAIQPSKSTFWVTSQMSKYDQDNLYKYCAHKNVKAILSLMKLTTAATVSS